MQAQADCSDKRAFISIVWINHKIDNCLDNIKL